MSKPEQSSSEEKISQELAAAQQKIGELQQQVERYTYMASDFENFRRRIDKERSQWSEVVAMKILSDFLPLVDDFERAFATLDKNPALQVYEQGFQLIYQSLKKILISHGVHEMENITHFDPEFHEAIAKIPAESHESGSIVEVVKKGYLYKDKLLRPASVVVAQ